MNNFDQVIESFGNKNLKVIYLLSRANKMPYCKRNILKAKILFWSFIYSELTQRLILDIKKPERHLNINNECKDFLLKNNLANEKITNLFFAFHEPLTAAFLRFLEQELSNGHDFECKMRLIESELLELLQIAANELDGMSLDCTSFGCEPVCPMYKKSGISECEFQGVDHIFTLFVTPEYYLEQDLFDKLVDNLELLKDVRETIMIVNYRLMCDRFIKYNWDQEGAWARYTKLKSYVKEIYFYNFDNCVNFGKHTKEIKHLMIPNIDAKKELVKHWREDKELIYF